MTRFTLIKPFLFCVLRWQRPCH